MKKIIKSQISSERLMKNDELMTLRGGTEPVPKQYGCYKNGSSGGNCNLHITDLYAADCDSALATCMVVFEGSCVQGVDC